MRALIVLAWVVVGGLLCGTATAGNPPASFTDRLEGDAPGTVEVGSRANLSWAATAQVCTYAGSTFPSGVRFEDWPTDPGAGTTAPACSGFASCASPHAYTFFLGTPGAYHFQVTCLTSGGPAVTSSIDVIVVEAPSAERVALSLSASTSGPVRPGIPFSYTAALNNNGGFRLTAPTTTLTLPPELSFVSSSCASASGSAVTWSLPNGLGAGESATCQISVRLGAIPSGESVLTTARTTFSILSSSFVLTTSELIGTARRSRPLSVTRSGAPTTLDSVTPVISGDGSLVLFSTRQRGLADDDGNTSGTDVVLKDRRDGSARVVSVGSAGALRGISSSPTISANGRAFAFIYEPVASRAGELPKAGETGQLCSAPPNGLFRPICTTTAPNGQALSGPAEGPTMSADGSLMAFCSSASNWVSGDTNGAKDVFVMNMSTRAVTMVSATFAGVPGNGPSCDAAIAGNGKSVVFRTRAANLGGTATWQLVRKSLTTGQLQRLSQGADGSAANADAGKPSVSFTGQRVTFASRATNLVAGLTSGASNVYIYYTPGGAAIGLDAGQPKDIGNGLFGVRNRGGGEPNGDADDPAISCNGSVVAFGSTASDLMSGDIGGNKDVFLVDAQSGETRRALATGGGGDANGPSTSPAINCEGTSLVFQSAATNIDPNDPNANSDIYVQDDPRNVANGTPTSLDASFSGNWFNPGQSGHGFLVEALPDGRYYLTWYLYVNGQPLFLQGVGGASGNVLDIPVFSTRSTAFPVGPGGGTNSNWGRLRMTFSGNDTASVQWLPTAFGFSAGSMTLRRLTAPALVQSDVTSQTIKACYSGVWFEPTRSGYGFNLEVIEQGNSRAVVTYWYTYRPDGSPLWLSGVGSAADGVVRVDLYEGGGSGAQFPFNFVADAVTQTRWGSATLRFTSNNTLDVSYAPALSGYAAGSASLVRLTELAGRACVN
ncbi:hypothetical protein [Tahibacter sp.]|uniref:hypothetical protein n=1 Tax=Tahibacter sp. TaxID=2056211 RepID=UPI0028C45ED3|nr:hypothetical protein [Tahibacter sp.]